MTMPNLFAASIDGRWRPGIGDPTVMGWLTVVAYFAAGAGCFRAAWREPREERSPREPGPSRPSLFWLSLSAAMLALGINKQLDLQSLVTQIGRDVIKAQRLYHMRGDLQRAFIACVIVICAMALGLGLWLARGRIRDRWPALVGIMFLLGFIIIRAASFHHIDDLLMGRLGAVRWNWVFELGGIGWIVIAALSASRGHTHGPARPRRGSLDGP